VRGAKRVTALMGAQPLAVIPVITTSSEITQRRRRFWTILAVTAAAILLTVLIYHFAIQPLDVLWHATMRRLAL